MKEVAMKRRTFLKGAVASAAVAAVTPALTPDAEAPTDNDKPTAYWMHDPVLEPHSVDELVEQMRRWEAGEYDRHDVVVALMKDRWLQQGPDPEYRIDKRVLDQCPRWLGPSQVKFWSGPPAGSPLG